MPRLAIKAQPFVPQYGAGATTATLDEAGRQFAALLPRLASLAEEEPPRVCCISQRTLAVRKSKSDTVAKPHVSAATAAQGVGEAGKRRRHAKNFGALRWWRCGLLRLHSSRRRVVPARGAARPRANTGC
jgi:hypothetical protein